jgi:hypothetical protein
MKKLKGIKFKRVDGVLRPLLNQKCGPETGTEPDGMGGCRSIPKIADLNSPVYGYGDYTPEPKIPEPEPTSQADCSQGLVFAPSYTVTLGIKCQVPPCGTREVRVPAMCKYPESQNDCPSGTKYVAGKSYVGCPPGWPKELGCMPSRQFEPGMCVGTPVITTPTEKIGGKLAPSSVQNSLQSLMDKNWLLPAIAIGVGVYLITRKS